MPAKKQPPQTLSGRILQAVLWDLRDRKGFDDWWDNIESSVQREAKKELLAKIEKVTAQSNAAPWCPDFCPVTRLPFFMWIEPPEGGVMVPTYGGPFDSYTIPKMDDQTSLPWHEREYTREHYDHDQGCWVECESVPMRVINESELYRLQEIAESDVDIANLNCPHCQSTLLWSEDRGLHCDGCDEFDSSSLAASPDSAWLPIGTAPKDGTKIDVWRAGEFPGRWTDVYWGKPDHECGESGEYCDSDWHGADPDWVCSSFQEFLHFKPTHWMPTPLPPNI